MNKSTDGVRIFEHVDTEQATSPLPWTSMQEMLLDNNKKISDIKLQQNIYNMILSLQYIGTVCNFCRASAPRSTIMCRHLQFDPTLLPQSRFEI